MTYTKQGETITLTMTQDDYETLLLVVGIAAGSSFLPNRALFWRLMQFANEMNTGNPQFTPYEIPEGAL